jgi:hypothetical protein
MIEAPLLGLFIFKTLFMLFENFSIMASTTHLPTPFSLLPQQLLNFSRAEVGLIASHLPSETSS